MAKRAEAIYEARIRTLVEKEHFGKVISIDVNSGDYEIAEGQDDQLGAIDASHRSRRPRCSLVPMARARWGFVVPAARDAGMRASGGYRLALEAA